MELCMQYIILQARLKKEQGYRDKKQKAEHLLNAKEEIARKVAREVMSNWILR